jgi:YD repeat-containing protein
MIPLVVAGAESQKVADPGSPKGIPRVVWDSRDRLVEVKSGGVTVGTYKYDVNGLRVGINDAGGERRILLDGIEELAEYEAGAMSQVNRWDRDPTRVDALLAQVAGGKHHAVTDALGSVYGMTDSTGAVVNRASFDAYGARTTTTATVPTDRGFTGRRHDPTGAMYYRARYYEPGWGGGPLSIPFGMKSASEHRCAVSTRRRTRMCTP